MGGEMDKLNEVMGEVCATCVIGSLVRDICLDAHKSQRMSRTRQTLSV